jgi:thioredoxin reductase (NADPH)
VFCGATGIEPSSLSGKRVFIVGGGNSAGQAAISLANYARNVTLLVRGEKLTTGMSQYLIDQLRTKANILIETNTNVHFAIGKRALRALCTSRNGIKSVARKADALVIMIGADADTHWLPGDLQRNEEGFIRTGRNVFASAFWDEDRSPFPLETSMPGIFCAGDARDGSIKRVSSAVGEGGMAIAFVHRFLALTQESKSSPASSPLQPKRQACNFNL